MGVSVMDIKQVRIDRLKDIIEQMGGAAEVERKHEISASYLSQLLNGFRTIGEKSARNLEQKLNLPTMYLDQQNSYSNKDNLTPDLIAHLKVMQQLPDYARTEVMRDAIKTAELINKATELAKHNGTYQ
jgi:transcriptional regulator with XRE-family HTH domain